MILILTGNMQNNDMKHTALYFWIAAALLAACSSQDKNLQSLVQDDLVFYASFEQPAEEYSRVYANEDLLLRWNADDRVSIFNKNTYNQEYRFIGETGDYEGGFNKVGDPEFMTGKEIPHVVSVYPFQRQTRVTEDETVHVMLPTEQSYVKNSFGLGANTMVSVSLGNLLYYKNVGGYLMLKIYGEGVSVSSITLQGNNGEKLAGNACITTPIDGNPSVEMESNATTDITLICETPIPLGANAEESTQFWFVVPPVTFDKGFTITINNSRGGIIRKSTSKSIIIERNMLSTMSPIDGAYPIPEAVDLGLSVQWASFNLGASKPEEDGGYFAWGELETKSRTEYNWAGYMFCNGDDKSFTKYCNNSEYGYNGFKDNLSILEPEDDAAQVFLGRTWRIPTWQEIMELQQQCEWTWTEKNGRNGYLVKSNINGNSIFFPACGQGKIAESVIVGGINKEGRYWSSSVSSAYPPVSIILIFDSTEVKQLSNNYLHTQKRSHGLAIRPVLD